MKSNILLLVCVIVTQLSFAQNAPPEYAILIKKASELYEARDYKASAFAYSAAFKTFGWMGYVDDRYNAARSWALAGYPDSAFFNLNRIVSKGYYTKYDQIVADTNLISLRNDMHWQPLLKDIKANKEKAEAYLHNPLTPQLDSIFSDDQKIRQMMDNVEKRYGYRSKEMDELWHVQNEKDSINLLKVEEILDKHGWLGADSIGQQGNTTLFLVIQHSNLKTQEKYLPMMKEAVKNKKARTAELALLIDRVEMGNRRPQIYGSQIQMKDGKYEPYQITDIANVDKRRAEVGLGPLEEYVKHWNKDYKLPTK